MTQKSMKRKSNVIKTPVTSGRKRIYNIIFFILIIAAGFLIYSNSLNSEFQFDDESNIVEDQCIRNLKCFTEFSTWSNINKRPVSRFSFALNYHIHGISLPGFHFTNLIIHIITGLLIFLLIKILLSTSYFRDNEIFEYREVIALFVSLLFIVHPLQTQSVTYIIQRMTSLSGMFYILSIYLYINGRLLHIGRKINPKTVIYYTTAMLSGLLAAFSKQSGVTFPLAMLLVEFFFIRSRENRLYKKYLIVSMSVFIFMFFIIAVTGYLPKETNEISRSDYFITQSKVILKYIQLLLIPVGQNIDHDFNISKTLWNLKELGSFFIILILFATGVFLYKRNRLVSFGIFWFFLCLSVESTIIPISDVIFEHRLYLPMLGFSLCLVTITYRLFTSKRIKYFIISLTITTIIYGIFTYNRNNVWKTKYSLWLDSVEKSPQKPRALTSLGHALIKKGEMEKAKEYLNKALRENPDYIHALFKLGVISYNYKKYDKALEYYNRAYSINPKFVDVINNIGAVYLATGNNDKALDFFNRALKLKPKETGMIINIGVIWFSKGDFDKAIEYFMRALKIMPNNLRALKNIGIAYDEKGDSIKALQYFNKVIKLDPNDTEAIQYINSLNKKLR